MQIKNRKLLMILTFILVISSTIAYSALTSTLQIDAEAKLRTVSDIRVSGISLSSASGATLQYESSYDINTITSGFILPTTDSSITYKVTVTNNGTIDQTIYDILTQSSNNSGLYYEISGYNVKDVIGFKSEVEFYITYKTTTPSNDVINVVNKFNFKEVYHITFETKGGTSIPEAIKYEGVDLSLTPYSSTKQGYLLSGWTDEQAGTTVKYQTNGTYTLNRDLILYALWTVDPNTSYKVKHYVHDLGTNTYTLNSTDNLTGATNSSITLSTKKKSIAGFTYVDGYLTGGTTKPTSGAVTTTTVLADGSRVINLYYRRNYLYVQYHINGGSLDSTHGTGYSVSNNLITYTGNTTNTNFLRGVYGGKVGGINTDTYVNNGTGLHDYNSTTGINIVKNGYIGKSGQEWNTSSDGTGTSYNQATTTYDANNFGGVNLSTGDKTVKLYVNWVPVNYEIQYDLQGGTLANSNPATYNIETDTFTLNNPTQTGYIFLGWTGSNGTTPQTTVTITKGSYGDKAYIANWQANTYTVTADANGGSIPTTTGWTGTGLTATKSVTYDSQYGTLPTPTRTGYTFQGWNGKNLFNMSKWLDLCTSASAGTINKGNNSITLTATTNNRGAYTITYYVTRATYGDLNSYKLNVKPNTTYTLSWKTDSDKPGRVYVFVNDKDNNDGDNNMFGSNSTSHKLTFTTPSDAEFIRMRVDVNNTGDSITYSDFQLEEGTTATSYEPYYVTSSTNVTQAKDHTLKAIWEPVDYEITYDLQGGTLSAANPATYNIETNTFTLNNPTLTGYTFTGWTGSNGETPQTTVTIPTGSTGDKAYIANWQVNNYTLTANANGGSIASTTGWTGTGNTSTKSVVYDSAYGTLPTVSRAGYTFKGWSLLPEGYTQVEYIQSSGTQYIDTGVKFNNDTDKFILDYRANDANGNYFIAGSGWTENGKIWVYSYKNGNEIAIYVTDVNGTQRKFSGIAGPDTERHTVLYDARMLYIDDIATANNTGHSFGETPYNFGLFNSLNSTGHYSKSKIYSFRLWKSGTLTRDMIPCINESTGKAGMYDLVTNTFYGNSGTGDFTAGDEEFITSETIVKETRNHNIYAKWIDNTAPTIISATPSSALDLRNYIEFNATDAGSGIVGYNITTSTTAPTNWIPVVDTVEETTETKYDLDAAWARVFHHNNHWGAKYFTDAAEAQSITNDNDKYSVLGNIANYKNTSNWEFLLQYPDVSSTLYNRWTQTDNPITTNLPSTSTGTKVGGYTAIHTDWTGSYFGGLALSTADTKTYIDGATGHGNWFYAIGSYSAYQGGTPGPSSTSGIKVSSVNLWSRIDNLTTTTTSNNLTRRIGDIKEDGTYYIWVKNSAGNTSSQAVTISNVDTTVPTASITSTNNVAASQKATLTLGDNKALDKYYFGTTDPNNTNVTYTTIANSPTSSKPTKTVSSNGTYYLSVVDKAGNRTIANKVFYKTTLQPNKGSVSPSSVITLKGNQFTIPTPGATAGYTFNGWYTDEELTISAGTTYKPTSNATLYGKWTAVNYEITYDLQGGTLSTANPTTYNAETETFTLNNPTKEGYEFIGWTGSNGTTPQTAVTIPKGSTGDKAYIANWQSNEYTITYDANDGYFGYPVTTSPTTTNIVTYTKNGNTVTTYADGVKYREYKKPIRDGYRFDGWSTSKTATTPTYTDESSAKTIILTEGSTTLYAVWTRVWAENLSYDNTNTGVNCSDAQCMLDYLATRLTNKGTTKFKVGDLVQMTPSTSSYTTMTNYTGYSSTETINPKELNLWRVIRVNSDGTVDAVSEYVSSIDLYFQGTIGYQNFSGYLNKLASQYENPRYTVGSRIMGYNGQTEFITDTSYFDGTDLKAGTEWTSSTSGTPAEEYLGRGDSLYQTDYDLVKAAYGGASDSAKTNKVGTATATIYWIGSRYYSWHYSTYFSFGGRNVNASGNISSYYLHYYRNGSWSVVSSSYALRPIITLRSGLTARGSGTSSDPYVLN